MRNNTLFFIFLFHSFYGTCKYTRRNRRKRREKSSFPGALELKLEKTRPEFTLKTRDKTPSS